jgi:hypothetical protein
MPKKSDEPINTSKIAPGQPAPVGGIYQEIGPRGGTPGREVTVAKGKILPPTSDSNRYYTLVRAADASAGRKR